MNRKSWIATVSGLAIASLVLVVGSANASDYAYSKSRNSAVYDYARVLSVTPAIRYVTVTTPVKECWEDVERYSVRNHEPGRAGKALFGAIVGGVIGHQIGSGSGNDVATIAGSLIGASVAGNSHRGRGYSTSEYSRPVRRCETNYQSHQEERIDGYDVIYTYHGRKYATRTPFDPGKKLKIRVDVRPAS
jgi:uncharacterized protein YcfJ